MNKQLDKLPPCDSPKCVSAADYEGLILSTGQTVKLCHKHFHEYPESSIKFVCRLVLTTEALMRAIRELNNSSKPVVTPVTDQVHDPGPLIGPSQFCTRCGICLENNHMHRTSELAQFEIGSPVLERTTGTRADDEDQQMTEFLTISEDQAAGIPLCREGGA